MAQYTTDTTSRIIRECGAIEQGAPSAQAAAQLAKRYAWLDRAREAGVDVDGLIAEERGW